MATAHISLAPLHINNQPSDLSEIRTTIRIS